MKYSKEANKDDGKPSRVSQNKLKIISIRNFSRANSFEWQYKTKKNDFEIPIFPDWDGILYIYRWVESSSVYFMYSRKTEKW